MIDWTASLALRHRSQPLQLITAGDFYFKELLPNWQISQIFNLSINNQINLIMNLKQQLEQAAMGVYCDQEGDNHCHNFYDWFCKDSSLERKAKGLFSKLRTFLKHHPEIDTETTYCFFKNNCPMFGSSYDDFRICDIETGDVIYTVTPSVGHNSKKGQAEIWGSANNFEGPIKTARTFSELFEKTVVSTND